MKLAWNRDGFPWLTKETDNPLETPIHHDTEREAREQGDKRTTQDEQAGHFHREITRNYGINKEPLSQPGGAKRIGAQRCEPVNHPLAE